jgi:hypothetical protein
MSLFLPVDRIFHLQSHPLVEFFVLRSDIESAYDIVVHTDMDDVELTVSEPVYESTLLRLAYDIHAVTAVVEGARMVAVDRMMNLIVDQPWMALGEMLGAHQ